MESQWPEEILSTVTSLYTCITYFIKRGVKQTKNNIIRYHRQNHFRYLKTVFHFKFYDEEQNIVDVCVSDVNNGALLSWWTRREEFGTDMTLQQSLKRNHLVLEAFLKMPSVRLQ